MAFLRSLKIFPSRPEKKIFIFYPPTLSSLSQLLPHQFFSGFFMFAKASLGPESVTSFTWLKRARALRTWVAFSRGSLRF